MRMVTGDRLSLQRGGAVADGAQAEAHAGIAAPAGVPHRVLACLSDSSRTPAIAAEAWRLAGVAGGRCVFLHVGPDQPQTRAALRRALTAAGVPPDHPVLFRDGEPSRVVRAVAEDERIDVIVAGVLDRRTTFSDHFGSVAGQIAATAPCSVLLLTEPRIDRPPRQRLAVSVDFDETSAGMLAAVVAWGRLEGVRRWHVLHEYDARGFYSSLNAPAAESQASLTRRLGEFIRCVDWSGLYVKRLCLSNKHGCDALWYARAVRADALCLPVSPRRQRFWERLLRFRIDIDVEALPPAILLFRDRDVNQLDEPPSEP